MKNFLKPIKKKSVAEEVILRIKQLIEDGHIKDGEKLPPERELSSILKVSRASLREGLRALSVLGVLELKQGDGTYLNISLFSLPTDPLRFLLFFEKLTLIELFETRKAIEVEAAGLAARRRSNEDICRMKAALEEMRRRVDEKEEYNRHEVQFHQVIIEASKNSMMIKIMDMLNELLWESRLKTAEIEDLKEDFSHHERILEAMERGDADEAKLRMYKHLDITESRLRDTISNIR